MNPSKIPSKRDFTGRKEYNEIMARLLFRGLAHRESLWKWRVLLPNFQWEEYSCNCASGYSGKRCEMGHILICEGESGQLRCNKEGKINVLSANYGRLDSHSCPHWMTTDTNCHSGNSLAQEQQIYQSNSTCELEATNVFFGGDPCMGTYKYLFIEYQCQWHLTLRKFKII